MDLDEDYPEDDDYYYYNEEAESDEDTDEEGVGALPSWGGGFSQGTYCGFIPSFLSRHYPPPPHTYLTQEEADRNARQLVEEEEREKAKANKKRLKKKKQKERRRLQRLQETPGGATAPEESAVPPPEEEEPEQCDGSLSGSEDDLDLGSTFVRKVQKKMASKPKPERRERPREAARTKERAPERGHQKAAPPQPDPQTNLIKMIRYKIQESMELAGLGNNLAKQERFADSLHFYTEALKINPSEYRFLGNRSYSYERLARYNEALADAETALQLKPDFLKGFFRKGKALKGLKRYSEAIAAFQQVILCDADHVEATQEIAQCQRHLQESVLGIRVNILSSAPLSPAVAPPSAPGNNQKVFVSRNIYNTKSASSRDPTPPPGRAVTAATQSKFFPIWVGNVTAAVTEEILRSVFEPFGSLHSIRTLHSRTCAFINFTHKQAAESAFNALQGLQVGGSTLVLQLRNPEHSAAAARKQ